MERGKKVKSSRGVERLERCPDPSRLRDTEICNTFITSVLCKNAAHLLSRMQAGGQREEEERGGDRAREVGKKRR